MAMLRWPRALLLLTMLGAAPAEAGRFARHAVGVAEIAGTPRPMTVTAPDGRTRAIARFSEGRHDDDHLNVFLGGDDHYFAGGPNAELLWAPDSRAIAVTANDGGAVGGFELSILAKRKKGRHWRRIDVTERVARLFAPQSHCDEPESPNVGAIGWTSGQRLIVAAQVPPHSSCRNMGHVAAYIVDVPTGAVLMEVDPRTLHRRYGKTLGTMFSGHRGRRHHRERTD